MNITASGVSYFDKSFPAGRKVLIDLAGSSEQFNGITATFGYKAADGEFSPFVMPDGTPIATTSRGGFEVRVPRSGLVGVKLSYGPALDGLILDVIPAVDMPPGS